MKMDRRFSVPTDIIFGLHSSSQVGAESKRLGISIPLVVTDAGVSGTGILDEALTSLKESNLPFVFFDQAPAEPVTKTIEQLVVLLKDNGCDGVITAGGGSAMCAGKGVALMATNKGNIRDYAGVDRFTNAPLPCIAIPTTAGSGSEVSKATIITDEQTWRHIAVIGYSNAPRVAILDPILLRTVPRGQAVASGVDALTHAIEALCSRFATPLTDGIALSAMEMIFKNLCASVLGDDLEAQGEMLFAASMANIACGNAGLGLVHGMNGAITYLYKARDYTPVADGFINAICLPHVLGFNLPVREAKLALMATALGAKESGKSQRELAIEAVERVKELLVTLDAPRRLPWEGIPSQELKEMAELTLGGARLVENPRRPSEQEMVCLFEKALEDWGTRRADSDC